MRTLVCAIAKLENLYIREWVEWYKDKGFTNVCLFDNNDIDGERFEEVIGDYIESGFVFLKDFRGKERMQKQAYQMCYDEYGKDYDWIGFFDIDEFFDTDKKNVSEFLSQPKFNGFGSIRLCWKNYTDNGLLRVENDNYSIKRFTEPVYFDTICNRHSKIMVRGGQDIKFSQEPGGEHGVGMNCNAVDCHGNVYDNKSFVLKEKIWDDAWLNHYRFKTMEEYCVLKMKRLYPCVDAAEAKRMLRKKDFFEYNEWTPEKDKMYHELMGDESNAVVCCILNYKHDDGAKFWYDRCKTEFKTYIIDTNYLDNGGEWPFDKNDPNILKEHNLYYGGSVLKSYELLKKNNGQWLLTITSDVKCDAGNSQRFGYVIQDIINRKDIGVWDPSAAQGSMCNGSTQIILSNVHQYNHNFGVREVRCGEGWLELVRGDVCDELLPKLNYDDNKLGWGINDAFNRISRKKGLKVVIDDRLIVFHPGGTAYSQQEASKEYERLKLRFAEFGITEPEDKKAEEIKTLICCIGKNENRYVREYVEWYKKIGVTKIRIYDNNDPDGERFEDVIGDYVKDGFVEIVDYRGKKDCQHDAYNICYEEEKNNYDWILFIDCGDEYLSFVHTKTIGEYLAMPQFVNFDIIHINLMTFGDCGKIHYEDKPLAERFPSPIPFDTKIAYDFPENCHVSSIVRGGKEKVIFSKVSGWSHTPSPTTLRCCNDVGITVDGNSPVQNVDFQLAFFRHYTTKTAEEYCDKMRRGFPDQEWDGSRVQNLIETRFFRTNEITKEKVEVFKEKLGIDMSYLLPHVFDGEKNKDVKIYTLCYAKKNFQFLDDEVVTPLQVGAANGTDVCVLKDNTGDNISDKNYFYIENTGTYWIWKNVHDCKYKGQMQYRRPLQGVDGKMDFEDIFSKYDVITCEPFYHPDHKKPTETEKLVIVADTVEQGYAFSNCVDDLYVLEMVIKMFHPDYAEDYDKYIKNGPNLYYSSGYIMRSEDYDRYCEFLFDCLEKWQQFANIHSKEELFAHVKYNMEVGKYPRYGGDKSIINNEVAVRWQSSIGGFLGERIWTLWLQHNFQQDKIYKLPYVKMEEGMYT